MKIKDGNKAVSDVAYLFSELCAIYPITPSSPMASNIDNLAIKNQKNMFGDTVKVIEMQSEAGAAGTLHGALSAGILASTFTSSQGLLLMIPNMYKIAGEMLPAVFHVASRSISTHALSIFGDHQDIYATRQTGFCMLASSSVEEAQSMAAIAHLSAISSSLPFLQFFDGFRTSHEINTIDDFPTDKIINLVDKEKINEFRSRALNVGNNIQKGMAQNEDIYFQTTEARNLNYEQVPNIVENYMDKINEIMNTNLKPFNYYGDKNAENIIIAMGSVCDTIRLVVDDLNKKAQKVGMIEVHLYRPFCKNYLKKVLPKSVKNIAVLDKTKEAGSIYEPLCLDVIASLKDMSLNIVGGRYGLSSKNVSPAQIKSVFDMLKNKLQDHFVIGIVDDVTNLSLPLSDYKLNVKANEVVVYGYGSDGMVSGCKEVATIVNTVNNKFVQAYFEYDSKKSGGVTKSSLRIGKEKIKAPFYIDNPKCVVITKDDYLHMFDTISNIKEYGLVLLNTTHEKDIDDFLPNSFKKNIIDKHLKLLVIDAYKIANKYNLSGKISKIMEIILLELLGVSDAISILSEQIRQKFQTKGRDVIENNIKAIENTLDKVVLIDEDLNVIDEKPHFSHSIFDIIERREGNTLKVSDLLEYADGAIPCSFSKHSSSVKVSKIPHWKSENCIQCGKCSFVCPHGVIRPFIVKKGGIPLLGDKTNLKQFLIGINGDKCTGCGLCINVCPGISNKKALSFGKNTTSTYVKELFESHENEVPANIFNVKNSQLMRPKFCYSGACAGCGETSYIKLLTQLLQEKLIIANATGCSSIYGGSMPNTVYNIPWASSLFEDNAEFGYGIYMAYKTLRNRIRNLMTSTYEYVDEQVKKEYDKYFNNFDDYKITLQVKQNLEKSSIPSSLKKLLNYIPARDVWCIGGDGWAYDIGFSGIDHILSSNENINILLLDTESYSNTGGQASKATSKGAIAEFASNGKKTNKKDLFKMAMSYPNVYVASVSLMANNNQCIKAFKEAIEHKGPSIIIAYSTCIEQGIKSGMATSCNQQSALVNCGYLLLMRYSNNKLYLDSKEPDFEKYEEVLNQEVRYNALMIKNKKQAQTLLALNKQNAIDRYNYFKNLAE